MKHATYARHWTYDDSKLSLFDFMRRRLHDHAAMREASGVQRPPAWQSHSPAPAFTPTLPQSPASSVTSSKLLQGSILQLLILKMGATSTQVGVNFYVSTLLG